MAFVRPPLPFPRATQRLRGVCLQNATRHATQPQRCARVCMTAATSGFSPAPGPESLGEELVEAAMMSDFLAVQRALNDGAPAAYRSARAGMTALHWSASGGSVEIAELLLSAGLSVDDVNAKTADGYSAMLYAIENMPNTPVSSRPPPPPGFPNSSSPEIRKKKPKQTGLGAKQTGHSGVAKLLIVRGADVSVKNQYDEDLLFLAARKGKVEWLDLLISKGLSPRTQNLGYKHTPLHISAIEGHSDCVRYLLSLPNVDIDATNIVGWSPLLWAAATGSVECAEALIEAGADVNIRGQGANDADGQPTVTTPLMESRKCGEPAKMARVLIRAGAVE